MKIRDLQARSQIPTPVRRAIDFLDRQGKDDVFSRSEIESALGYKDRALGSCLNHPGLSEYRFPGYRAGFLYCNKKYRSRIQKLLKQST